MRPKHLILSGWGPYKTICQIDFEAFEGKGLFLITGATGAGKTSIFDAICFALYGDMSGQMREKGSVRSDFADADTKTFVELTMEHAGQIYRIYRNPEYERLKKRKGGSSSYTKERENAILYLPDGTVIEGSQEVTRRMQELLVLNLKQFKQISMIAQGEFSRLLMAPSREKIAIFREIFGTEIYENFESVLRKRSRELYAKAAELKNKLEEAVRMLSLPEEAFRELTDTENLNFDAISEYLKDLEKVYRKNRQIAEKEYARIDKEITALTADISKIGENNRQITRRMECERKLAALKQEGPAMKTLEKEWKQAQNAGYLEPEQVSLQALKRQLELKEAHLEQTKEQITALKEEKIELHTVFSIREKIVAALRQKEVCEQLETQVKSQENYFKELEKDMADLPGKYMMQENVCRERRHIFEESDLAYKRATAGIVARLLEDGKPCPVCGSKVHPSPARAGDDVLDEKRLKELQKEVKDAENKLEQIHILVVEKTAQLEATKKQLEDITAQYEVESEKQKASEEYLKDFGNISIQESYQKLESITGRYQNLEGLIGEKENACLRLCEEIEAGKKEVEEQTEAFNRQLKKYGFSGFAQYEKCRKTPDEQKTMEKTLQDYREEKSTLEELIKQLGHGKEKKELTDTAPYLQKRQDLEAHKKEFLAEQKKWNIYLDAIRRTLLSIKEKLDELKKVSEEYGFVKDLDNVANGMNSKKLVFEQYVLASYFEEILRAANIRLLKMTGGRYEMSRPEKVGDGRSRDNLEIQVLDYYTGKFRSVKTLSGGESFKASLALALGMSDVIQAFHGGIRVDTLFVDEGFGSLDSESLDQACETLGTLVKRDHLIGIISHVPELRERIEHQLVVHKTNSGSTVQIVV